MVLMLLSVAVQAADHITFTSHPSRQSRTISGPEFSEYETIVQKLVAALGKTREISDIGPDATYIRADIEYRGKKYRINSWYPVNRMNPKIAFSEKYGMVFVASAEEKARIEAANSKRYKGMHKFWDDVAVMREQVVEKQSATRRPEIKDEVGPVFDAKKIEDLLAVAAREKWTYPRVFDALKDAGVTHYETVTTQHAITYYGLENMWDAPVPKEWKPLSVGDTLNKAALSVALKRVQRGQTNYTTFLKEIVAAGCAHYRVDMTARNVTYMSHSGDQVVEPVPPSQ